MSLFGLTFTNPALWAGAAAVVVPALIHWLTRRTPVRMVFPTVRFLKAAEASRSWPYRVRHYLLLLVRTAAVAALLLAFLKPVAPSRASAGAANASDGRAVIVILDASASMASAGPGQTPFARARVAARRIVEGLGPKDRVNLIRAEAAPRSSFSEPAANVPPLLRDLEAAKPTLHRADVDAALAEAARQLNAVAGLSPEVHVVSDFQRSNWAAARFDRLPDRARVVFVSVADEAPENVAVVEATPMPAAPAAGETVEAACKVVNYGRTPRNVAVELDFDGRRQTQDLFLDPGDAATATFRVRPPREGLYEGAVRIGEDALDADNVRGFVLRASDRVRVTLLSDEDPRDPLASHRFLMRAIDPYRSDEARPVSVEVIPSERFDRFAASKAHLVVVAGVRDFTEASARRLIEYLRDGGGVIYFLTAPVDGDNLRRLEAISEDGLTLPFRTTAFRDYGAGERLEHATFAGANFDDPVLQKFREYGALADIAFYRHFATERNAAQGQILIRYDNQSIAMARRSLGLGSILLCNFSPGPASSDLAKRPVFVPLVHEMLRGLRPLSGGVKAFAAGEAASTTVPLPSPQARLSFSDPEGRRINGTFEIGADEAAVFFPETPLTGFYRVYADDHHVGSVAVNLDGRESNLDALSPDQLRELSRVSRDRFVAAAGNELDRLDELLEGRPLWPWLLLAVLGLLGFEQTLVLAWRR